MPRILDRFPDADRRLSEEEKARVEELNKKYENEDTSEWPYPQRYTKLNPTMRSSGS